MNQGKIKLDDICDFVNGGAWNESEYTENGIPVLKVSNFNANSFSIENISYLSKKASNKYRKHVLKKNDLVVATVGSHQSLVNSAAGRTIAINQDISGFYLNQNAVFLRSKNLKILDQIYLTYLGESESFRNHIQVRGKGAANQMRIAIGDIKSYPVTLPPLPTQQKIAQILSAYDDLIENNLKRIKLLEEMAQITYEQWFVRMKFPNHETTPIDAETGLPGGWKKATLIEVCDLVMGQSPKSEFYNEEQQGLPFHQGVKGYGFRFPLNTSWSSKGKRIAQKGDVLFSVRAPVGRLNIAIEEIILGRGLSAIRHKGGFQSFLFYQLQKIFFEEDMMGGGAIFSSVTKNDMNRIELIIPSETLLRKFNDLAATIDKNIENLYLQNQNLKEARDILLPRLMTGMIDVDKNTHTAPTHTNEAISSEC